MLPKSNCFVKLGKQSGAGLSLLFTIIATKYGGDCKPSKSAKSMTENTLRRIKAGENDQLEELSTGSKGFVHKDNKGKKNRRWETLPNIEWGTNKQPWKTVAKQNLLFFHSTRSKKVFQRNGRNVT